MKWIGVLLVALAGLLTGVLYRANLGRRFRELCTLNRMMEEAETQIRYAAVPLRELLFSASEAHPTSRVLTELRHRLEAGEDTHVAFTAAVEKCAGELRFSREERLLLEQFGNGLGKTDVEGQTAHCRRYSGQLSALCEQLRTTIAVKGQLSVTVGLSMGVLAAILLL